jgi:hypothetical protein
VKKTHTRSGHRRSNLCTGKGQKVRRFGSGMKKGSANCDWLKGQVQRFGVQQVHFERRREQDGRWSSEAETGDRRGKAEIRQHSQSS